MVILLWTALAWAGKYDGVPSDVVVERVVPKAMAELFPRFTDLAELERIVPADCATDWERGVVTSGQGATARLTYTIGPLRRRLTMHVGDVRPDYFVELTHDGKRGFSTTLSSKAVDGGTAVELKTWLNPPPWPFKPLFFAKVKPAWERCWTAALEAL